MSWLDRLLGNDRELAETRYAGRESATDAAHRKRVQRHRHGGAARAAKQGQKYDDSRGTWFRR